MSEQAKTSSDPVTTSDPITAVTQHSSTFLSRVLGAIPVGVVVVDENLVIEAFNPAATSLTGVKGEEAIGRPYSEVLQTKDKPIADPLEEAMATGQSFVNQRFYLSNAPGQAERPIRHSASILTDEAGNVIGGVTIFADISRQVDLEQTLRRQRHYMNQVFDLAPYGIFTVDDNLVIQSFNQAAEKLTGFAASFAEGKPYTEIVRVKEADADPLPRVITENDGNVYVRLTISDAGGKEVPLLYGAAPLTGPNDGLEGGIAVFQDIGDIVAAERTKDEFVSMVSHELRTPLTSVKGFITAVLDGKTGPINDKQKHFLTICRDQSNLLLDLINDLLDLSRLETDKVEIDKGRIDVAVLLRQAANRIAPLAEREKHVVRVDCAPDLPYLWADEEKLLQILQNLLSNAIKFSPPDTAIELAAARAEEDMVVLQVRDQGMGISQADQDRIFDPFYQVENIQTRQVGGTGLGLAIVRNIVEAHHGRIEVESELGQGTTFYIYLPLVSPSASAVWERSAAGDTADETRPRPIPPPVAPRETPLILIIEDDPSTKALIQFTLEEAGYKTISAANGREALQVAAAEQPDLITLDILMPEIDGFHVLDALKKAPETAGIPVCIVSIIQDKVRGYRLGAINYISKPFESEELLSAVHDVFQPQSATEDRTILVVEDDPNMVELIDITLSDVGYEIIVAQDGVVALEKLRSHLPALVLLDIMIPKIDGYEFIHQAKSDPRTADIPIVVLSVRTLEEDINRALRLGAEKYLTKVGDGDDLLQAIPEIVKELVPDEQ